LGKRKTNTETEVYREKNSKLYEMSRKYKRVHTKLKLLCMVSMVRSMFLWNAWYMAYFKTKNLYITMPLTTHLGI